MNLKHAWKEEHIVNFPEKQLVVDCYYFGKFNIQLAKVQKPLKQ